MQMSNLQVNFPDFVLLIHGSIPILIQSCMGNEYGRHKTMFVVYLHVMLEVKLGSKKQFLVDAVTPVLIDQRLSEFMQTLSLQLPLYQMKLRPNLHQLVYYFQNVSLIVYVRANVSESDQYIDHPYKKSQSE